MAARPAANPTDHTPSAHAPTAEQQSPIPGPPGSSPVPPPTAPRNRTRAWLLRIAGTLLFVALLAWLDLSGALPLEKVWAALSGADFRLVALSIAFYVPFLLVKAARWRIVSASLNVPLSWGDAWRIYAIGLAAGTFTPGQAGDALKAWYVQRKGYTLARGLGSSVLDRLFDVGGLAVLGLVGVLVYGGRFAGQAPALVAWVVVCVAAMTFLAWNRTRTWAVNFVARRLARFGGPSPASEGGWSLDAPTVAYAELLTLNAYDAGYRLIVAH